MSSELVDPNVALEQRTMDTQFAYLVREDHNGVQFYDYHGVLHRDPIDCFLKFDSVDLAANFGLRKGLKDLCVPGVSYKVAKLRLSRPLRREYYNLLSKPS